MNLPKIILFMFVFGIHNIVVFSQDPIMENKIEDIKALGKDAIITLASDILEKKYPTLKIIPNDFTITAWSNKKEVLVNFKRIIRYTPLGQEQSNLNYDLSINLITHMVDPLEIWRIDRFYRPTKEEIKQIEFVKKAFNLPYSGFDHEVCEKEDKYEIRIDNEVSYGIYYIDKITGKEIIDATIQGSYDIMSGAQITEGVIDEDPLIEIKEQK